jgi:2-polyprenyl-6-methoxyphenol hydroxylase-like FAD-dependent oxidoreductase
MSPATNVRCCIAGGGPAGMMLGLLLARAGIEVAVLEKHADFFRDFRGDTVHPSTLDVMHELGLLEGLLARPHDKARRLHVSIGGTDVDVADFSRLGTRCGFIAMMPQWEFLDFLRQEAGRYPNFRLLVNAEVTGLEQRGGRITGVQIQTPEGAGSITADLVIGADGRSSAVRDAAGMTVKNMGAPIDVLWMRIPVRAGDPAESGGRIDAGHFLALIYRTTYWQCAYVIPKDGFGAIKARGLDAFHAQLIASAPMFAGREHELRSWDDIKLLSVKVDRLERWWKPGLLCIGDAAHAMSPIGGVGINLAVQDAVAAANLLTEALADPSTPAAQLDACLARVEQRRLLPARVTQAVQVAAQNRLLVPVLDSERNRPLEVPWLLRLIDRWPTLQFLPAYAVGVGVRPEHVKFKSAGRPVKKA